MLVLRRLGKRVNMYSARDGILEARSMLVTQIDGF